MKNKEIQFGLIYNGEAYVLAETEVDNPCSICDLHDYCTEGESWLGYVCQGMAGKEGLAYEKTIFRKVE